MEFKTDKRLTYILLLARNAHKKRNIKGLQTNMSDATKRIKQVMDLASDYDKIKTAIAIEHACLSFDKDISSTISHRTIETQLDGCINALNNLDTLQNNPKKYIQDFLRSNTSIDSSNAFTNAVRANSVYLGSIMRAPATSDTCLTEFYTTRKKCLTTARKVYIERRTQLLKPHIQELTETRANKKGLER